jgi:hypothetical protein
MFKRGAIKPEQIKYSKSPYLTFAWKSPEQE